jgi:hypothetical protein
MRDFEVWSLRLDWRKCNRYSDGERGDSEKRDVENIDFEIFFC